MVELGGGLPPPLFFNNLMRRKLNFSVEGIRYVKRKFRGLKQIWRHRFSPGPPSKNLVLALDTNNITAYAI